MKASVRPSMEFRFVLRSDFLLCQPSIDGGLALRLHTRDLHCCCRETLLKVQPPALIDHKSLALARFTIGYYQVFEQLIRHPAIVPIQPLATEVPAPCHIFQLYVKLTNRFSVLSDSYGRVRNRREL